ncbi:MAG: branched-chain amino acid ABC transporter permease [Gammaproteobacteria bacterium]|jgi:branched-chain amino acid transport system permease protein|nr:branched-chain amino acid ABC transporter permease [Gammaproteobacteria bacterium]MBU0788026.1 branched-chain amino acid ABC transporter permease [Gammaproteobacteria bacterium]MBU0815476.1 branched-chain amino acid ABC transporter permease [Gammaproteobacteria bacterium]MBU1785416.1 branched-chain amino acid ABC transporter permease [Gammaproteobacteria bacterium]
MKYWIISVALLASLLGVALSGANEYLFFAGFVVLQFVVLATAWNILGGYAGYVNFGVPAFVAVGAYTALVLFKSTGAPLVVQILGGAIMAGLLGLLVGLLTLRLRGIFFSIATIAVIFILEAVVMNWRFVGGASGLQLTRPNVPWIFETYTRMLFFVMAVMAFIAVSVARYIQSSHIGRGLRALRDSEEAAECSGVPTLKLKLIACTISGALLGAAGAPMPMYLSFIEPASTFNLSYAVSALAMVIIGGIGHWAGPLIGAILLGSIQQIVTVTISNELNVMVVGILLVLFVVIAPDGVLGLVKKWKQSSK